MSLFLTGYFVMNLIGKSFAVHVYYMVAAILRMAEIYGLIGLLLGVFYFQKSEIRVRNIFQPITKQIVYILEKNLKILYGCCITIIPDAKESRKALVINLQAILTDFRTHVDTIFAYNVFINQSDSLRTRTVLPFVYFLVQIVLGFGLSEFAILLQLWLIF